MPDINIDHEHNKGFPLAGKPSLLSPFPALLRGKRHVHLTAKHHPDKVLGRLPAKEGGPELG
jgi:hypothetical protein